MKNKYPNRIVTNRKSPANEDAFIAAYNKLVPSSKKNDKLDVSAVRAKDGTPGHALLDQSINRGKDGNAHRGQNFVSDSELKKTMKK